MYVVPPMNEYSTVPLHLFQTWHSLHLPPYMAKCVNDLKRANPEFTHHLYDDTMCRDFIQQHFDSEVVYAYDTLIPGAYKADLWRYCILYIHGGIYLDIKYTCVPPFKLMELTKKEHYVHDRDYIGMDGIYQALLVCYPKNPILYACIRKIVDYVYQNEYGKTCLFVGPHLMGTYFCKMELQQMSLEFKGTVITMNTRPVLSIYPEYRRELSQFSPKKYYSDLWLQRSVYAYRNLVPYESSTSPMEVSSACIQDKILYTSGKKVYSCSLTWDNVVEVSLRCERLRLYTHENHTYGLGMVHTNKGTRICSGMYPTLKIIQPMFHASTHSESMWCMILHENKVKVVYSWYPLVIGVMDYTKYQLSISHINYHVPTFFKHLYTSTNSVPWEDTQWVVLSKPTCYIVNQKKYIKYEYIFVVLDNDARVLRYSEFFTVDQGHISDLYVGEYVQLVYTTPQGKCCISKYTWNSINAMRWIHNSAL